MVYFMKNVSKNNNSYDVDKFSDKENEIKRLQQQASILRDMELAILSGAGGQNAKKILELGCGPGFVTKLLRSLNSEADILAIDYSFELLKQAVAGFEDLPEKISFLQASGYQLPLNDGSVDFAYARFLLQHVQDPQAMIAEAGRALTSGGRLCVVDSDDGLILTYPENAQLKDAMSEIQSEQTRRGGDRFIGRKIQMMLHKAGFCNIRSRIVNVTSSEMPWAVLFNVLFGYKSLLLKDKTIIEKIRIDVGNSVAEGGFLISGGVFIVTGEKV
jgi:ubiquinone/menaquinone biosynthesis C-methylase UbiE